jgi:hypothetical protein
MVDGIALVDHFGWDAFNESTDLITQIESYKKRYGCFPEVVLADGIWHQSQPELYEEIQYQVWW